VPALATTPKAYNADADAADPSTKVGRAGGPAPPARALWSGQRFALGLVVAVRKRVGDRPLPQGQPGVR
jgi:hypothetical protein